MDKLELGLKLGVYHDGWDLPHYFRDADARKAWICCIKWGEKGSRKSGSMLEDGYSAYHEFDEFVPSLHKDGSPILDAAGQPVLVGKITNWEDMDAWEEVKKSFIFRPRDFTEILRESLKGHQHLGWLGWDDINIHLPRSMYFTKRKLWETMAKNWEGMRANLSIFECTAPRKDRVASFILGDMNWEALCSSQQIEADRRWFWESDYYDPEKVNKYRIDIREKPISEHHVPKEIWDWYWDLKTRLTDESTAGMVETLEEIDNPAPPKPPKPKTAAQEEAEAARAKLAS